MIHFNNTTGKNKGKLQITKLAKYLNKSESALRAIRKKDDKYLDVLRFGALCVANSISEKDLESIVSSSGNSGCTFIDNTANFPIGYMQDLILHNLGWCLCNTSRKDFMKHIKKVEEDFFGVMVGWYVGENKLQDTIKHAYLNRDNFRCTAIPIFKDGLQIEPCLLGFVSSMIQSVSNIASYGRTEKESKIFNWMNRKTTLNIEEFYMAYFRICDDSYSYTQVLKHFKKAKKD